MVASDDMDRWDGSRWAALRVLLHGVLIPSFEEWTDIKQGLSMWRRALHVRPPLPLPGPMAPSPHRRPVGRIVQARKDCWHLVDPQARGDMVRFASLFPGHSLDCREFVWAVRDGGWDLTPRRAAPLLRALVESGHLKQANRRQFTWLPECLEPSTLDTPEIHLSRFLNDLGLVLPQTMGRLPGSKLWAVGAHIPPSTLPPLTDMIFSGIITILDDASTEVSTDSPANPEEHRIIRFSALGTLDPEMPLGQEPDTETLGLLLATVGGEFGRQIGDFSRADEVLQKELIESLTQRAKEEGAALLPFLKERCGIGTWRTLDRWRNQRSMAQIEATTLERGLAWAEGWILEELAGIWPEGRSQRELVEHIARSFGSRRSLEQKDLGALLASLRRRGLIKRESGTPSKFIIGQPDRFVSVSRLAAMERDMIASLQPLARSLGTPGVWGEHRVARTGMWIVKRRDLEGLSERIREQIAAAMNASQRSTENRDHGLYHQPKRAKAARIFMLLRPSPLP